MPIAEARREPMKITRIHDDECGFWLSLGSAMIWRKSCLSHFYISFRSCRWGCIDKRSRPAFCKHLPGIQNSVKLNDLGHQSSPAGLMAGAQSGAVVAVEIFVEQDMVAPVGIALELFCAAIDRPPAMLVGGKYPGEPVGNLFAHLKQIHHLA